MSQLKALKKIYDKLGNDRMRSRALTAAEHFGVRKDIIRMDTNGYCNIRCIMCGQLKATEKNQFMSFDNFTKVMDLLGSTTRMLYLSCAYEPLITPNFADYLRYAKQKGIPHISFCTNALLLNKPMIACLIKEQIDEIIISFNGFTEETYNRIMKGSDFHKVCKNLSALEEYKKAHHSSKPHIRFNTILMKSNLKNFSEMHEFLRQHDIDTIQFRELMIMDGQNDKAEVKNELISNLSKADYLKTADEIRKMAAELRGMGKEIILPETFGTYPEQAAPAADSVGISETEGCDQKEYVIQKEKNTQKRSCSIPYFSYWIDRDGGVRICGYDEKGSLGNILDQPFVDLKKKRKEFRRLALGGECSNELCTMNMDTSTII